MAATLPPPKKRLTHFHLRELKFHLPKPCLSENLTKAQFRVYQAKPLFSSKWSHSILKRLVVEARKSYQIYGDVPKLDKYDSKSAIYLTHVSYSAETAKRARIQIEEWASLRFVPASGKPPSNEDLDFYVYQERKKEKPILTLMRKRIKTLRGLSLKETKQRIVAHSRICAIRPYATNTSDQVLIGQIQKNNKYPGRNLHLALSFALMNKQFLKDIRSKGIPIKIITCQMHLDLTNLILSFPPFSGSKKMPFVQAYQKLGLQGPHSVYLERTNPKVYAYRYPGYFLNLEDLVKILQALINQSLLSQKVIEKYLPSKVSWEQMKERPRMFHCQKMGKLLTIRDRIPGTKITGEKLRQILDEKVKDGPILRIMSVRTWRTGLEKMIDFARQSS